MVYILVEFNALRLALLDAAQIIVNPHLRGAAQQFLISQPRQYASVLKGLGVRIENGVQWLEIAGTEGVDDAEVNAATVHVLVRGELYEVWIRAAMAAAGSAAPAQATGSQMRAWRFFEPAAAVSPVSREPPKEHAPTPVVLPPLAEAGWPMNAPAVQQAPAPPAAKQNRQPRLRNEPAAAAQPSPAEAAKRRTREKTTPWAAGGAAATPPGQATIYNSKPRAEHLVPFDEDLSRGPIWVEIYWDEYRGWYTGQVLGQTPNKVPCSDRAQWVVYYPKMQTLGQEEDGPHYVALGGRYGRPWRRAPPPPGARLLTKSQIAALAEPEEDGNRAQLGSGAGGSRAAKRARGPEKAAAKATAVPELPEKGSLRVRVISDVNRHLVVADAALGRLPASWVLTRNGFGIDKGLTVTIKAVDGASYHCELFKTSAARRTKVTLSVTSFTASLGTKVQKGVEVILLLNSEGTPLFGAALESAGQLPEIVTVGRAQQLLSDVHAVAAEQFLLVASKTIKSSHRTDRYDISLRFARSEGYLPQIWIPAKPGSTNAVPVTIKDLNGVSHECSVLLCESRHFVLKADSYVKATGLRVDDTFCLFKKGDELLGRPNDHVGKAGAEPAVPRPQPPSAAAAGQWPRRVDPVDLGGSPSTVAPEVIPSYAPSARGLTMVLKKVIHASSTRAFRLNPEDVKSLVGAQSAKSAFEGVEYAFDVRRADGGDLYKCMLNVTDNNRCKLDGLSPIIMRSKTLFFYHDTRKNIFVSSKLLDIEDKDDGDLGGGAGPSAAAGGDGGDGEDVHAANEDNYYDAYDGEGGGWDTGAYEYDEVGGQAMAKLGAFAAYDGRGGVGELPKGEGVYEGGATEASDSDSDDSLPKPFAPFPQELWCGVYAPPANGSVRLSSVGMTSTARDGSAAAMAAPPRSDPWKSWP